MTLDEFISTWTGRGADFDNFYGDQCVDLVQFYNRDVIGCQTRLTGNAIDIKDTYPQDIYSWISIATDIAAQRGDIVIWGQPFGPYYDGWQTQYAGHIAIFLEKTDAGFNSFDQNWPVNSLPHIQPHTYEGVLGWLRAKKSITSSQTPMQDWTKLHEINGALNTPDDVIAFIKTIQDDSGKKDQAITAKDAQILDLQKQVGNFPIEKQGLIAQMDTECQTKLSTQRQELLMDSTSQIKALEGQIDDLKENGTTTIQKVETPLKDRFHEKSMAVKLPAALEIILA